MDIKPTTDYYTLHVLQYSPMSQLKLLNLNLIWLMAGLNYWKSDVLMYNKNDLVYAGALPINYF